MAHTEDRALKLLGQGLSTGVVASALGVTDGRISQLLADPDFAASVQQLRFKGLQESTALDSTYNSLEEKLLEKLEAQLPLINKPRDLLQAVNVINGAKRRGADAPDSSDLAAKVVQLTLPQVIQQKFVVNVLNQVTEVKGAGDAAQTLVTVTPGDLDALAKRGSGSGAKTLNIAEAATARPSESGRAEKPVTLADTL